MRKIFWLDLETTGLEDDCVILEAAAVITDHRLNPLKGFVGVIHHDDSVLESMNDWCKKTHGASGLTQQVRSSEATLESVENSLLELIEELSTEDRIVLAGSSVHFDKGFIKRYMPRLHKRLHYRIIDVSSFTEVLNIVYGVPAETKPAKHRALDDIHGSINTLRGHLRHIDLKPLD